MELNNMKRKQLQALCKKHGIPANKTNLEMATLLASILKVSESENALSETKEEEEEEVIDGNNDDKSRKKVRFSPDVETREYEPSVYKGRGGRVCRKRNVADSKQLVKKKKKVVDEEVEAKRRRVSGDNRGKNVAASEGKESEFELGKGKALVGRRKSVVARKNDEKKGDVGNILDKSENVCLEIGNLKRKELQSLCKKHGIPANKSNSEMASLLVAALNVSQQAAIETRHEIDSMEQLNEDEASGVGDVGELIDEENVIMKEQSNFVATEAAVTHTNSLIEKPIQDTTPQMTRSVSNTKSRSNTKISDLDAVLCAEENQNSTPVLHELLTSQTKIIACSSANQPGLEIEDLSTGKDSQTENCDFNDHSSENDCSIQVESSDIKTHVDVEASASLEVGHNESDALGTILEAQEIYSTVQDDERDIGLILPSNNNEQDNVELRDEASVKGAYEEALHSQNFGDSVAEITEESKDIVDCGNHSASKIISELDIPEEISEDQKEKTVLETDCSADAAQVIGCKDVDVDVDSLAEERTVQDEDLGCDTQVEMIGGNSYQEVSPCTHYEGYPTINLTSCEGSEVSRMEIVDSAVTPDSEIAITTLNSKKIELQDANDGEVASNLDGNFDERVSQNIQDENRFSEEWSVEQSEENETESKFGYSQISDFTQSIHDNLAEAINGETMDNGTHTESPKTLEASEINDEAIDNGTHMESPKTQEAPNGSSSGPCIFDLLFPEEREEFTEMQSAAPETLLGSLSEDSKDPIGTSKTVNDLLEIDFEKSGQLDNLAEELNTPLALTSNKKQAKQSFTEEFPIYSKSSGKSEKKSIDTLSELQELPFYAIEKELTEQGWDNNNENVEIVHSFDVEGMPIEASVGALVADKLTFSPAVDSVVTQGDINASIDKHDNANQLREIDDVVNEENSWSDINFSNPNELTSEDINKGCVMSANEVPLHKPIVHDSSDIRNHEPMDVEGFLLNSSSKCEILEDSSAVSIVNVSHYDREQDVEKPASEEQQLSLLNKDVMEILENVQMNTLTAGELEDQHDENVYSEIEKVTELNMSDSRDVSEFAHNEINEHSSMQDKIQGYCSAEIEEERAVIRKDDFSGGVGVNEQFLSEDVQTNSSVLDQCFSCINAVVGQEITSTFEDQHGQTLQHLEEDGVEEAKMCSNHDISKPLNMGETEQHNLPLKGVQIQGSSPPEINKDQNVKVENNTVNKEDNEIAGLVDSPTETLSSVRELPSSARNQSISPFNATVGQEIGTDDGNNVESELKLPSAETTSLIVKQQEHPSVISKQLLSLALQRRSVLIHGTPKRVFDASEMKENIHSTKMQEAGNLTVQRALPKRRPLEDVRKM